jgi:hypothetical protein
MTPWCHDGARQVADRDGATMGTTKDQFSSIRRAGFFFFLMGLGDWSERRQDVPEVAEHLDSVTGHNSTSCPFHDLRLTVQS